MQRYPYAVGREHFSHVMKTQRKATDQTLPSMHASMHEAARSDAEQTGLKRKPGLTFALDVIVDPEELARGLHRRMCCVLHRKGELVDTEYAPGF